MAKEQSVARKPSQSKSDDRSKGDNRKKSGSGTKHSNGEDPATAQLEKELAGYLQKRIKPNLNSGAIPLLARSIAKDLAHRDLPANGSRSAGAAEAPKAESDDKPKGEQAEQEKAPDFEADMHELQAELGEHWILRFSVHGDEAWLTAETDDGSQRIEAQTAAVIADAVALINDGGGRSG